MILKASQRGGGKQLAVHLLKTTENEHVEVHELRGFMADDLQSAFHEIYAVSRGTRAKQFLFSLSLSPPPKERVSLDVFETAIEDIEAKLGLEGQPRAIVFHEKDGRRHAHVVWSRIKSDEMKAINLPHFKLKLRDVSRQLYLENGWQMPRGLMNSKERDPKNFTRQEWEQAKRAGHDAKALKAMFQECWASSDSRKAFAQALQARGYYLAQGDRRGYVAMDYRGEIYALAKWTGIRTKDVRGKLGWAEDLPTLQDVKKTIFERMSEMVRGHIADAKRNHEKQAATLAFRKAQIVDRQRKEREDFNAFQQQRWDRETVSRAQRLNRGFRGLWDRVTGKHSQQTKENEREAMQAMRRDRDEKDALIGRHIEERQAFHQQARLLHQAHTKDLEQLHRDVANFIHIGGPERPDIREHFRTASQTITKDRKRNARDRDIKREI